MDEIPPREGKTMGRSSAAGVGIASLISAGVGYVVLLVAARTLDGAANAEFLTFWSVVFLVFGILGGIVIESTRSAKAAAELTAAERGPRIVYLALLLGGIAAAAVLGTSFVWAGPMFGSLASTLVPVICLAALLYAGHSAVVGVLGGSGRWSQYSTVIASESVLRLLAVIAVVLVGASISGLAAATALGAGAWVVLVLVSKRSRVAFSVRADVSGARFTRNILHSCLAATANAAILVGFPAMMKLTTEDSIYLASAPLLMALSLTRAPLMIPLTAYQSVAITHFMSRKSQGARAYLGLFSVVLGVAAVGAAAAALIGPRLMVFLLGQDYYVSGALLAALTLDSGFLALLTLTGALTVASGRHRAYSLGWVVASLVSLSVLLLPMGIEVKTVVSLAAGPICGIMVHTWFVHRSVRTSTQTVG